MNLIDTTNVIHISESVNVKNKKNFYLSIKITKNRNNTKIVQINYIYLAILYALFNNMSEKIVRKQIKLT